MPRLKIDTHNAVVRGIITQKLITLGINTNAALAKRMGINYRTYMRKMQCPGTLTVDDLRKLSNILRFSDDEILAVVKRK